jgi:hypothetical protein
VRTGLPPPPNAHTEEALRVKWTIDGFGFRLHEHHRGRVALALATPTLLSLIGLVVGLFSGFGMMFISFFVALLMLGLGFNWARPLVAVRVTPSGIEVGKKRIPWSNVNIELVNKQFFVGDRILNASRPIKAEDLRWLITCLEAVRGQGQRGGPQDVPTELRQVVGRKSDQAQNPTRSKVHQ